MVMDEDFMDFYADWANDFIWTKEFEVSTAEDFTKFEKLIEARKWEGLDDIPY